MKKTHKVEMSRKALRAFREFMDEQSIAGKDLSAYMNEEMKNLDLKAQIIKAMNALDAIAQLVDQAQNKIYVKPALDKLIALRDEVE